MVSLLWILSTDTPQPPRKENSRPLTVWGALDPPAMHHILQEFARNGEHPTVKYIEFNTLDLYNNFLNSTEKPDIVLSSAMDLQVKIVNDGYARNFIPRFKINIPEWASWRNELYGFSFEPAVILYNTRIMPNNGLPHTHMDLSTWIENNLPILKGKIGTYDIEHSALGYLFASQDKLQNDQSLQLLKSFGKSDIKLYRSTLQMLDELKSGDLAIIYNAIGSYALEFSYRNPHLQILQMQDYLPTIYRTAFISNASKMVPEAESFINFLLSPRGQIALLRANMIPLSHYDNYTSTYLKGTSLYKVPLDVGLLTFQDKIKKEQFIETWKKATTHNY
jgi:ABC-type Fe3+ transport system substrate-binding protein